jgi:hypothetical protein
MKVRLDLSKHCIETAIRKQYHRTLSRYFKTPDQREALQAELEVLIHAMESFDFPLLRRTYPELEGHGSHEVILEMDGGNHPVVHLNGERILN